MEIILENNYLKHNLDLISLLNKVNLKSYHRMALIRLSRRFSTHNFYWNKFISPEAEILTSLTIRNVLKYYWIIKIT